MKTPIFSKSITEEFWKNDEISCGEVQMILVEE
jgi:hypothetical protein